MPIVLTLMAIMHSTIEAITLLSKETQLPSTDNRAGAVLTKATKWHVPAQHA